MRKALTVFVTNNGLAPFRDRYDGEDFTIAPGATLEIEADCAKLVFGFGEQDKARAIRRLGWAPTSDQMREALERLYTFAFHTADPTSSLSAPASGMGAAAPPPVGSAASGHAASSPVTPSPAPTQPPELDEYEPYVRSDRDLDRPRVNALNKLTAVTDAAA